MVESFLFSTIGSCPCLPDYAPSPVRQLLWCNDCCAFIFTALANLYKSVRCEGSLSLPAKATFCIWICQKIRGQKSISSDESGSYRRPCAKTLHPALYCKKKVESMIHSVSFWCIKPNPSCVSTGDQLYWIWHSCIIESPQDPEGPRSIGNRQRELIGSLAARTTSHSTSISPLFPSHPFCLHADLTHVASAKPDRI